MECLVMAINPNNALDAEHVCYLAGTGGGKTAAVKLLKLWGEHVAIFDMYGDYKFDGRKKKNPFNGLGGRQVFHFSTRNTFAKSFVDAWRSGKRFVMAYQPEFSASLQGKELKAAKQSELYWFGQLVWAASDGNRQLDVIIEELAKLANTAGKDDTIVGELATGGRKFGIHLHTIFQRSQEVPKTIWNNSPRKVLGAQESKGDAEAISKELDTPLSHVFQLSILNNKHKKKRLYYLVKSTGGIGNITPMMIDIKTGHNKTVEIKAYLSA
jgi:hypothetical protein